MEPMFNFLQYVTYDVFETHNMPKLRVPEGTGPSISLYKSASILIFERIVDVPAKVNIKHPKSGR